MHAYEIVKLTSEMVQRFPRDQLDLIELTSEMVQQFPREQLDLIEHIGRAKETAQLKLQGEEHDSEAEDNEEYYTVDPHDEYEEYGDVTVSDKDFKLQQVIS
jgi:hypothetical protein